jgi:hypothetical protein
MPAVLVFYEKLYGMPFVHKEAGDVAGIEIF